MIILPPIEDFLNACGSELPNMIIHQAVPDIDFKHETIPEDYFVACKIGIELIKTYHSWLVAQLASPDLIEI